MNKKFSVLMSVYIKEKASNLEEAINSIYENQKLKPNEIILVEDGPLTQELYDCIENLKIKIGNILKIVKLERNMGLGEALSRGLLECSNELVARMDTDDIAHSDRFLKQVEYFNQNEKIDILGTYMFEFSEKPTNIISIKEAPMKDIGIYIKRRCPLNHPTVMFKKSKVIEAGNYRSFYLNEDTYLRARMYSKGAIFANLPETLLYFRVDENTFKRRGGLKYTKSEWDIQKEFLKLGITTKLDFFINMVLKTGVRLLPNSLRRYIYIKFLRKKVRKGEK